MTQGIPEGTPPRAPEPNEFHDTDNWFFSRLPDGSVRIVHRGEIEGLAYDLEHVVTVNGWESVVAFLADGGSAEAHSLAETLHKRTPVPAPAAK